MLGVIQVASEARNKTKDILPSLANPNTVKVVKSGDRCTVSAENEVRKYLREAAVSRPVTGEPKVDIQFFRITDATEIEVNERKITKLEGHLQLNVSPAGEPPVFEDNLLLTNLYDINGKIKEASESIYQFRYDSQTNAWYVIDFCDDGSSSSSDSCILLPCSNFWGISLSDGNVNAYDHSGIFIDLIQTPFSWTECGIEEGDIVGIDTDENCIPKITPDPCTVIKRLCGSSSSSSAGSTPPYGDEIPCECVPAISIDFNRFFGVTNSKGTFFQLGTGQTLTRQAKPNPYASGVYFHDEDPNWPTLPQNPPSLAPEIFNNGVALGPEYVACLGVDECTCWSFIDAP